MRNAIAYRRAVVYEIRRFAITVSFAAISLLTFPFQPMTRPRLIPAWSPVVLGWAWVVCGARSRVIGREHFPQQPCIVLSKHQSAWETLAYQVILPPQVWVLKRELLRVPFFGWGLAMMSPIAIDRGSASRALKQMVEQGRRRLADGWWIVVFPEGTRIAPGKRARYHPGGAWLACKTGAPVVPIAHNAGTVWGRNAFVKHAGTITVSVGPVIVPEAMTPDELNRKVEDWIEIEVTRLGNARS